jgi:hypothetical protein
MTPPGDGWLDQGVAYKPLDCGNGRVAASVAPDGAVLALAGFHPLHGHAGFIAQPPFPDADRGDGQAVRGYRAGMAARGAAGFGLTPPRRWDVVGVRCVAGVDPTAHLARGRVRATVTTTAPHGTHGIVQQWRLRVVGGKPLLFTYRLAGALWAGRSAMTELTEGGVVSQPPAAVVARVRSGALTVTNPAVPVCVAVTGVPDVAWEQEGDGPVEAAFDATVELEPDAEVTVLLTWALGEDPRTATERARALRRPPRGPPGSGTAVRRDRWPSLRRTVPMSVQPLVRRGLAYARACCTLPTTNGTSVIADHRILPLAWTRDAYYAVAALAAAEDPDAGELLLTHLRWLYAAERRDGAWGRAYLPNGRVKDPAFQLDQQCYPLLELAEALQRWPQERGLSPYIASAFEVLGAIRARQAPSAPLFATEETPADDPLDLPYHFSSHVLVWYTLRRLADVLEDRDLARMADAVATATREHFTVRRRERSLFAYAVDLAGNRRLYHDANDLPTALGPGWAFCAADDPVWRATMAFAFSPDNSGWTSGRYGGLGSDHTPGAWPLGDVQELAYRHALGDAVGERLVAQRLLATAAWDGALPEARDPDSGDIASRHWFAWPGAALAYVYLTRTPRG